MRPSHELAHIVQRHLSDYIREQPLEPQQLSALHAIAECRTEALGGHKSSCNSCGKQTYSYNSCRNRHCPKCQATNRERWITQREAELLPVRYFHVVFTIPHELNDLARTHPKTVYNALFTAAWQTVKNLSKDYKHLGAKTGMTAVLHTWGQQLWLHPHLHCIIPAGGITSQGRWKSTKRKGKYLYPQKVLAKIFRAKFVEQVRKEVVIPFSVAKLIFSKPWIVYAKQPFNTPKTVVEYLGRYTHKVAISNHRIKNINDDYVDFSYKDYRNKNKTKIMRLTPFEFIRRFQQHILPKGFTRMRHYGILASRNKPKELNMAKTHFGLEAWKQVKVTWLELTITKLGINPYKCTSCAKGMMEITQIITPERGPPSNKDLLPNQNFYEK